MERRLAHGPRGLSLLETLLSLFVLLSTFVIVLSLLFRSSDYLVNVERKVVAVTFAETVLEDIKAWAKDYSNYSGDWSAWNDTTLAEYPGYRAQVTAVTPTVANPCGQLELGKPAAEQTLMLDSYRDLTLTVRFDGSTQLTLQTRLAEPARPIKEVSVSAVTGGGSIGRGSQAAYRAILLDSANLEISDVSFRWSVEPITGNGTAITQEPDTALADLKNAYIGNDGVSRFVPGTCRLRAVARYRGIEYVGLSPEVVLLP
jgi:type II secretory pathway pseudopilin PulG